MQWRQFFIIKLKDPFDTLVDALRPSLFILFTLGASQYCDCEQDHLLVWKH